MIKVFHQRSFKDQERIIIVMILLKNNVFQKNPLIINAFVQIFNSGKTIKKKRKEKREMINLVWIFSYSSKWLVFPKQRREISIFQFYSMNVIYDKNSVVIIMAKIIEMKCLYKCVRFERHKNSTIKFHFLKLLPEKFLQFDWLRAEVLQLKFKFKFKFNNSFYQCTK